MIIEGIIIGSVVALLTVGAAGLRSVYRLSGKVENGLIDRMVRIEARVDALYHHLIGDDDAGDP